MSDGRRDTFSKFYFKSTRGENSRNAKLTDAMVRTIRERAKTESNTEIAKDFCVSRSCIANIVRRATWRHVE